ncbi:MAG: putative enzyme related to lactoylglutathione lyase [Francisellaceae bacterium]|jgi:predicted enzyme related to lactoylglutathione lyase
MSELHHFCWNELLSKDIEKDKIFYKEVFGWESEDKQFGGMTYTLFKADGVEVAGMMPAPKECTNPSSSWLSYVTVDDVQATLDKAVAAGAKVVLPKMKIENIGDLAAIIDVQGAAVGFYKSKGC